MSRTLAVRVAGWGLGPALCLAVCSAGGCDVARALPADTGDMTTTAGDGASDGGSPCSRSPTHKLDILFMIDNSLGMEPMTAQLRSQLTALVQPFVDMANNRATFADLHIGVVTSDYGAGATGAPSCGKSPGGQLGKLQARGLAARPSCKSPIGANYISYVYDRNGAAGANNLPPTQDLVDTLDCMMEVGSSGCGFEHQLESVYAALRNNLPENAGFVRDDARLAVIFFTNEDDGSAPPDSDIFDPAKVAQYGFEDSYSRQTRFAIQCNGRQFPPHAQFPPYADSFGPLSNCASAPNSPTGAGPGKMYDVSRYIDLFTKPRAKGGVKDNPRDVYLYAVDGPDAPFQVILSNPGLFGLTGWAACGPLDEASNPPCVPVLQHSCVNGPRPEFFADPAIRLNTVIRAVQSYAPSSVASICDGVGDSLLASVANALGEPNCP